MPQVLIRNMDSDVIEKLRRRASDNRRSLEAELRVILERAAGEPTADPLQLVKRVQEMFEGRRLRDSVELIREDRER